MDAIMDVDTNSPVLHIKKAVHSSIRTCYQSACDYPLVLGAGILLLLLLKICPPLFSFLVSYSPLFLLTGLLLGALLSYGEACGPVTEEAAPDDQQVLSLKSKISVADCSTEEIENVTVEAHVEKTSVAADIVLTADAVSPKYVQSNVIVEREDHGETSEKAELQEFESVNAESGNRMLQDQYQLGEPMSSRWQSVDRQDPCSDSDSESDFTYESSSPDASMTDIIPMLEELHPLIDLGTGQPSLASRDNLDSSSDEDEDEVEEDDDTISDSEHEGEKREKDDGIIWEEVMGQNSKPDSLMELHRAKNLLKFELDQRLLDLQAADATQKLKEASRFHVQVPSISTPRQNPPNGSEEVIELPQVPVSAPSILHPRPFDQILENNGSQLQETWTPRLQSQATQLRNHENLRGRHSTKAQKGEDSSNDAHGSHLDSDAVQEGNDGMLFGSRQAHIGEEIKILTVAVSDPRVLKVDRGIDEGNEGVDISDGVKTSPVREIVCSTLEAKDSIHGGSEQEISCCLSKVNNSKPHVVESNSIGEVNSLFKCRMEEVLVQSISEASIEQPLTVRLDDDLSYPLSSDSGMHATEAGSVERLNSQFAHLNGEALAGSEPDITCSNGEALPAVNEHTSELPIEDGHLCELRVLEGSSVEDINTLVSRQPEEDVQAQMPQNSDHKLAHGTGVSASDILTLAAESSKDNSFAFEQLRNGHSKTNISQDVEVTLEPAELNSSDQNSG